jgi:hypothetical protein
MPKLISVAAINLFAARINALSRGGSIAVMWSVLRVSSAAV